MRHEQVKLRESFDILDAAEIWPRAGLAASTPLAEVEAAMPARAASAVPDMPTAVGRAILGIYASLIAVFLLTMGRSTEASFMIVVSGLYLAIFFAIPRIFLRVEGDSSRRPDLARFMAEGMDTLTGRLSGAAALVQIFVVPVLLTLGILVIGLAARWSL